MAPKELLPDRNGAITAIRAALRRRSGKSWSVRGGRGTDYGWIDICSPPQRCGDYGTMTSDEIAELEELLGLTGQVVHSTSGISVSPENRREYIDRAEGRYVDEEAE